MMRTGLLRRIGLHRWSNFDAIPRLKFALKGGNTRLGRVGIHMGIFACSRHVVSR